MKNLLYKENVVKFKYVIPSKYLIVVHNYLITLVRYKMLSKQTFFEYHLHFSLETFYRRKRVWDVPFKRFCHDFY